MVCLLVLTQISLSAQSYKLPDYTTFKLANGLTIFLMERMTPVISVSALIPAGAINDKDKSGLASLTATALKHGTKISQKQSR
jgi:predicted Zn-dependent peptidase